MFCLRKDGPSGKSRGIRDRGGIEGEEMGEAGSKYIIHMYK